MQAFCGRRLWSLTCAATRSHSRPALMPLSMFYLPNSKGPHFFSPPTQAGPYRREQKQAEMGWGGREKTGALLLHPFLPQGACRACVLTGSKDLRGGLLCSVSPASHGRGDAAGNWGILQPGGLSCKYLCTSQDMNRLELASAAGCAALGGAPPANTAALL